MHRRHGPVAVLATVLLAACSTESQPEPLDDATITLMQYTHDQVNRKLVVKVRAGDETVRVDRVEVVSGAFTGTAPAEFDATIAAGGELDLRVPLGEPDCSVDLDADDVSVEFDVPGRGRVMIDDPAGADFLTDLHAEACAAQDLRTLMPVEWAPKWRVDGEGDGTRVRAPLRIGPLGSLPDEGQVVLTGLDGSVMWVLRSPDLQSGRPALSPGDRRTLMVEFVPNRCDAHVWESSRGFQFDLRVQIPGRDAEVLVPVVPTRAKQQLLSRAWHAQCGVPSG